MARTNLHELANRLLDGLNRSATDGTFEGKLRALATESGLNSVRSAEAIKLLEALGRIEVLQRGRRGRDTIVAINSTEPVTIADAEGMLSSRAGKRASKVSYDEVGQAAVDRLLALGRDDALRAAQVEAFAAETEKLRARVAELETSLEEAKANETDLRVRLRAAEETLERGEENLRRALGTSRPAESAPAPVPDEDARAVLDILRSGRA